MGKLIVIEGLDGSGKATQTDLLHQRFLRKNHPAERLTFPDYASKSSALVQMYLGGELGTLDEINPYGASIFYASDRYASFVGKWKKKYDEGTWFLSDRYTTSNIAYQMTRLPKNEWDAYIEWLEDLEYNKIGLPKPDCVLYLDMQPETSRKLLQKRYEGDSSKMDLHEKNLDYLLSCREAALYGAKKQNWHVIPVCDGEKPLSKEVVSDMIDAIILKEMKME